SSTTRIFVLSSAVIRGPSVSCSPEGATERIARGGGSAEPLDTGPHMIRSPDGATLRGGSPRRGYDPVGAISTRGSAEPPPLAILGRPFGAATTKPLRGFRSAVQPRPEHRQQLLGVHRLGQVVPRPGLDALLPVALHRLRG